MTTSFRTAWRLAIFSFACAALTGALMRYGMFAGLPAGLLLGDVRHAHSHLMFFAWVTPALILVATEAVRRAGGSFRAGPWCAIGAVVAGVLAYPPFLLSGYRLTPVGEAELPLSMITSGLNGAVWYAFAALFWLATRGLRRTIALRFVDGSIVLLLLSSLGAILLAAGGMTDLASQTQMDAFVDMFLTLFADGWFGLGVLAALLLTIFKAAAQRAGALSLGLWTLTAGLSLRTLARLGVDGFDLGSLRMVEAVGGAIAAVAWLLVVGVLFSVQRADGGDRTSRVVALAVLGLIAIKAVFEFVIAFPAGAAFVEREGLKILLLHVFLLGAVTLALGAAMRMLLGRAAWRGLGWFAFTVGVMLVCLLPLTGLWPAALSGPWVLRAAFYSSFGPPLAALITLPLSSALPSPANGPRTSRSAGPEPSSPPA